MDTLMINGILSMFRGKIKMNDKNNNWLCQHFNVQNAVAKNGRIMTFAAQVKPSVTWRKRLSVAVSL